jgi:hypothetical protein
VLWSGAAGLARQVAGEEFEKLNTVKKLEHMDFLKRRLEECYSWAQKGGTPASNMEGG